jgi:ankyrin repeat protein
VGCGVHAPARKALTRIQRGVACVRAGGSAMASEAFRRLCSAAERDDVAGIAAALLAGADPNACEGAHDAMPLQLAAYRGHVAAIAALLAAGAHVNGASSDGTTPLMRAVWHGHTAAIDALLAAGADVHHVNAVGQTALHWAPMWGQLDAARMLLEAGVRTDVRNNDGKRPIDVVSAPTCALA